VSEQELEQANDRIQAICEKIKLDTLEPAKAEAQEIIEQAKKEAERIKDHARREAEKILSELKGELEQERQIFSSSLVQAARQSVDLLKQKVETSLFNPALDHWLTEQIGSDVSCAKLIDVIVKAIEKDGIETNLQVVIPQHFSAPQICSLLSKEIGERLQKDSIKVADIDGGVLVRMMGQHVTLDLSKDVLVQIISSFVRKDFRRAFFTP